MVGLDPHAVLDLVHRDASSARGRGSRPACSVVGRQVLDEDERHAAVGDAFEERSERLETRRPTRPIPTMWKGNCALLPQAIATAKSGELTAGSSPDAF